MADKDKPAGVPISPSKMTDSVAEWPLHRVVEHLKQKEKDGKSDAELDCRLFHTSGIRMFNTIVDEVASSYGVSRGRICRWMSFHGAAIAAEDPTLKRLKEVGKRLRLLSLQSDSAAISGLRENVAAYFPLEIEAKRLSLYVYGSWVSSSFAELADLCGVAPFQVAQLYIVRSVLTEDIPNLEGVAARLEREVAWWDRWMSHRVDSLELVVSLWGES